jgi:hypothetical protein
MIRTTRLLLAFLAVFATSSMVVAVPAEAASKEEIKNAKAHVKDVSKQLKTFRKLKKKWNKATDKGKDTSSIEADIHAIVKSELNDLRRQGVSSKADRSEEGTDQWVERYRNTLVAVKNAKAEGRWKNQMDELEKMIETRAMRAEKYLARMEG